MVHVEKSDIFRRYVLSNPVRYIYIYIYLLYNLENIVQDTHSGFWNWFTFESTYFIKKNIRFLHLMENYCDNL